MSMNATQESNMQRTGYRTIVGKHALTDQQARVFDTLDPRPDIPWPQFNVGNLTHGAFRQVAAIERRRDLAGIGLKSHRGLCPYLFIWTKSPRI